MNKETALRKRKADSVLKVITPIVFILLFLAIWELAIAVFNIPVWAVAKPTQIISTIFTQFVENIWPDMWVTLKTILIAYPIGGILGILCAGLFTNSEFAAKGISPFITVLVCTPMMTLVPLLTIVFGFGLAPRITVVVIQTLAITNMNCCVGFLNVPTERKELMQSLKANRVVTFLKVTIPSAVSSIFTGLRLGFIVCMTTCIGAEFAGGNNGLGSAIIFNTQYIKLPLAFACIIMVAVIGIIGYELISLLENKLVRWHE